MICLPGNPFEQVATGTYKNETAYVFALLTLAFEQRTANLIALLPQLPQIEVRAELVTEITKRLDLRSEVQS